MSRVATVRCAPIGTNQAIPARVAGSAGLLNLPNRLTLARVILAPVFVVLLSFPCFICYGVAYLVFLAATITDYYDGKIARERNLITNFGKLLDPVADKVLIAAAFVMLMTLKELWIPAWTVVVILAREFLVTGARSLAASEGVVIGANKFGKAKAVLQMTYVFIFLFLAIADQPIHWWVPSFSEMYRRLLQYASCAAAVGVAVYTVYTGIQFARVNWQVLKLGKPS